MKSRLFSIALLFCSIISCKKNNPSSGTVITIQQPPVITDFEPTTGASGIPVQIFGENFGDSASNLSAEFNGTPATIYSAQDQNISVIVPPGVTTGKISVSRSGQTAVSSNLFTVLSGDHWKQLSGIPGVDSVNGRYTSIGFSVGGKGYMGLGDGNDGTYYNDLFQYDPATNTWKQAASCPLALGNAICMVINNIVYVGLGQTQVSVNSKAMFAYDPVTDTWTRKADFPGQARALALGVPMGNIGLVGLGSDYNGNGLSDVWLYDPASDSWTQKKDFSASPIPDFPVGFSLDNKTALITGTSHYQNGLSAINVLYQYDPVADSWIQKQFRPGYEMTQPSTMIINGNGYVVGGGEEAWMYQGATDTWMQIQFFTQRRAAASFVIGNIGYFGNGAGLNDKALTDLWQFTP